MDFLIKQLAHLFFMENSDDLNKYYEQNRNIYLYLSIYIWK